MTSRRLLAGRPVRPVGLGCMGMSWGYGPAMRDEDAVRLLHRALDLGYDHVDTAALYGGGRSETLVGRALAHNRDKVLIASKVGLFAQGGGRGIDCRPETIRAGCEASLANLGLDHIDLFYLHRLDPQVPVEESVGAMADLVAAGKIGAIGLSEMSAATLRRAAAVHPIAAMQTEYSPWSRNAEIAVLDATRDLGVAFVAFSPSGGACWPAASTIHRAWTGRTCAATCRASRQRTGPPTTAWPRTSRRWRRYAG